METRPWCPNKQRTGKLRESSTHTPEHSEDSGKKKATPTHCPETVGLGEREQRKAYSLKHPSSSSQPERWAVDWEVGGTSELRLELCAAI